MLSENIRKLMKSNHDKALGILPRWIDMTELEKEALSLKDIVFVCRVMFPKSPEKAEVEELIKERAVSHKDRELVYVIGFLGDSERVKRARPDILDSVVDKAEKLLAEYE
jgi:hypothetical protein